MLASLLCLLERYHRDVITHLCPNFIDCLNCYTALALRTWMSYNILHKSVAVVTNPCKISVCPCYYDVSKRGLQGFIMDLSLLGACMDYMDPDVRCSKKVVNLKFSITHSLLQRQSLSVVLNYFFLCHQRHYTAGVSTVLVCINVLNCFAQKYVHICILYHFSDQLRHWLFGFSLNCITSENWFSTVTSILSLLLADSTQVISLLEIGSTGCFISPNYITSF